MIRAEVKELIALGAFPSSQQINLGLMERQEKLLLAIRRPVSADEARELIKLFGPDDYFGAAWTVLHLIESAPGWPFEDCLAGSSNEWVDLLRERARRGGL